MRAIRLLSILHQPKVQRDKGIRGQKDKGQWTMEQGFKGTRGQMTSDNGQGTKNRGLGIADDG